MSTQTKPAHWRARFPFMSISGGDIRHRFWVYCDICESTLGDAVPHDQAIEKATGHGEQHA